MADLTVDERDGRAHFAVRLVPRAAHAVVTGVREGVLQVRVTAAPVNGAANRALVELVAKSLRIGTTAVRIESGATGVRKRVSVPQEALGRLRALK